VQVKKRETRKDLYKLDVRPIPQVVHDPLYYCQSLNPIKIKILDRLLSFDTENRNIWMSQTTLAQELGISRQWCNQMLREMEDDGLFLSNYRHMRSNEYQVSSFFRSTKVRRLLAPLFRSFKVLFLVLLTQVNLHGSMKEDIILKSNYRRQKYSRVLTVKQLLLRNQLLESIKSKDHKINPISDAIRNIVGLPLTKWGQIKLSCFSDPVIEEVTYQFNNARGIKKPFNWFYYACLRYCKQNSLSPDWGWCRDLQIAFNMPTDAPMLLNHVDTSIRKPLSPSIPSHLVTSNLVTSNLTSSFKALRAKALTPEEREEKIRTEKGKIKNTDSEALNKLQNIFGPGVMDKFRDRVIGNLGASSICIST